MRPSARGDPSAPGADTGQVRAADTSVHRILSNRCPAAVQRHHRPEERKVKAARARESVGETQEETRGRALDGPALPHRLSSQTDRISHTWILKMLPPMLKHFCFSFDRHRVFKVFLMSLYRETTSQGRQVSSYS